MTAELETLTSEEQHAREAVRRLRMHGASSAFRARLKSEFIGGSISSGIERARLRDLLGGSLLLGRWVQPVAWAAAAALIVVSAIGFNHGPAWQVSGVSGAGIAVVGNRAIPLNHTEELAAALRPGVKIQVPAGAELEVMAGGHLAISIMAGTEVELPPSPGRWFARAIAARLERGELRITTGPRFRGARLAVHTPEAEVEVTGTTLAVICEPHGTCVCVLEGLVHVGPKGGEMAGVEEGRRRFVFNDGRSPENDDMRPMERDKLGMFREAMRAQLRGE